ncbi:EAL domain-containing protein [Sulfurimonas aquatica]|uniref:EAL domain-containing protein n=1 Tax=Sulfurimonas aquatica TaxID=2672570 RepID=A0A975GCI4_9BACT|nr:EAL domain-containing protein [Sulfurimonas aquatica]QSZ41660.1 EAL domain-containing protein [Sulfurimonas aquatica]
MKIKTNIFYLFYMVLSLSVIVFLILLNMKYNSIKESLYLEKQNDTQRIANNTHVQLLHYESILALLGEQLLYKNTYKRSKISKKIFKSVLDLNTEIMGFALLDINANYLSVSDNLDLKDVPNIRIKDEIRLSFLETLESEHMVIGRSYYLENAKSWVIPIRKAIRNDKGNVVAVMASGLKIHDDNTFLSKINFLDNSSLLIAKDFDSNDDSYSIYDSAIKNKDQDKYIRYNTPISKSIFQNIEYKKLKEIEKDISAPHLLEYVNNKNQSIYGAMSHDKRFKIFIITQNNSDIIKNQFINSILIYAVLFVLSILFLYTLTRFIEKLDKSQKSVLKYQATHDNLTTLPNRQHMYNNYNTFKKEAKEFELLYVDLDNFKNINDHFGHDFGDEILKEVASRLKKSVFKGDMLIRHGGDEFIIMKKTHIKNDTNYYEKIIEVLGKTYTVNSMEFILGASIGVSNYPKDSKNLTKLLSMSDMAMYEAKKQKNTFCIYSEDLKNSQTEYLEIEHELHNALAKNEIYMVYQPQINADGTLHGVEALVRWNNKKLGMVHPDKFIPIAEENGMIVELSRFIISKSAEDIYEVQRLLDIDFQLSINLSVRHLFSENFLENTLKDIKVFDGEYGLITFEITERLFIKDINHVLPLLNILKEKGFQISLDDFGTGYSSLGILRTLPINEIKIDKSFVDEMIHEHDARVLSKSIIKIGQDLSMKILAEGVETAEQLELLKFQNCEIFQGYYFSKPLDHMSLIAFLQKGISSAIPFYRFG